MCYALYISLDKGYGAIIVSTGRGRGEAKPTVLSVGEALSPRQTGRLICNAPPYLSVP